MSSNFKTRGVQDILHIRLLSSPVKDTLASGARMRCNFHFSRTLIHEAQYRHGCHGGIARDEMTILALIFVPFHRNFLTVLMQHSTYIRESGAD